MLRVGETIGQYEILAKLKAGGMATLFVGKKRGVAGFSRHVAIKVVHEHLASDQDFVRMFVDEALLQARMHHPNVVHVEELGEAEGNHFLVMEYVHGCSLAQLLDGLARRDRRLSPELAVHIAIHTLAGLHAAHELKDDDGTPLAVVHRDVSPQNVLLAYEGHVKLIDFGVAKARNRSQQTTGASLKGKLRYMPPEQAFGGEIDRRADIYALGIVLWEMLAFRKLFHAKDDLLLLDMVRSPRVKPPSTYAKGIPPALDAVVLKALAPKVEDRYATAQEFRRALAEALPKSMVVDAANVADLLVAVMGDQMKKDREALPSQLSAVVANDQRRQQLDTGQMEEALHTMTISAAGLAYLSDVSIDVDDPVRASALGPAAVLPKTRELFTPPPVDATRALPSGPAGAQDPTRDARRPLPARQEVTRALHAPGAALDSSDLRSSLPSPSATPLPTPIMAMPQPAPSRLPWIAAAVGGVLVFVVVTGAYLAMSTAPEPIATSLAPADPAAGMIAIPLTVPSVASTPIVEGPGAAIAAPSPAIEEPPGAEPPPAPPAAPIVEDVGVTAPPAPVTPSAEPPSAETPAAIAPARPRPRTGRPSHGSRVPLADEW